MSLDIFRKLSCLGILLSFISAYFILIPKEAVAGTCNFTYNPTPITTNTGDRVTVDFTSSDIPDDTYRAHRTGPSTLPVISDIVVSGGKGTFSIRRNVPWTAGKYEIYLVQQSKTVSDFKREAQCNGSYTITNTAGTTPTQSCVTNIKNPSIDPSTDVTLGIGGTLTIANNYDIKINSVSKKNYSTTDGDTVSLGTFPVGDHKVEIWEGCAAGGLGCLVGGSARLVCAPTAFRVVNRGPTPGGGEIKVENARVLLTNFCKDHQGLCSKAGGVKCPNDKPGIFTGIGCIPTEPKALVSGLLRFATFASGGIALLLMILAALSMITAEGNPDTIKKAQEKFYSAIIGLLLVIFATLLMQVIGVDILGLPGFGKAAP